MTDTNAHNLKIKIETDEHLLGILGGMNMTSTKKDILEWVKERLASVPDDAQMEVKIVMGCWHEGLLVEV